jgi:hypothetical protein
MKNLVAIALAGVLSTGAALAGDVPASVADQIRPGVDLTVLSAQSGVPLSTLIAEAQSRGMPVSGVTTTMASAGDARVDDVCDDGETLDDDGFCVAAVLPGAGGVIPGLGLGGGATAAIGGLAAVALVGAVASSSNGTNN